MKQKHVRTDPMKGLKAVNLILKELIEQNENST